MKVEAYKQKLDGEIKSAKRVEELQQRTAEYEKQKVHSIFFYYSNFLSKISLNACLSWKIVLENVSNILGAGTGSI